MGARWCKWVMLYIAKAVRSSRLVLALFRGVVLDKETQFEYEGGAETWLSSRCPAAVVAVVPLLSEAADGVGKR